MTPQEVHLRVLIHENPTRVQYVQYRTGTVVVVPVLYYSRQFGRWGPMFPTEADSTQNTLPHPDVTRRADVLGM